MLFLTFTIGKDRYALDTRQVLEVLPLVNYKSIPHTANGIAGVFNYHGTPVPLVDLSHLAIGRPAEAQMSTRIIVVHYTDPSSEVRVLGLKAEHVTETIRRTEKDFVQPGVSPEDAAYLGPVTMEAEQIIQRVDVRQLLPEAIVAQLSRDIRNLGQ
jgi:chemotaxis-related protein WspB